MISINDLNRRREYLYDRIFFVPQNVERKYNNNNEKTIFRFKFKNK